MIDECTGHRVGSLDWALAWCVKIRELRIEVMSNAATGGERERLAQEFGELEALWDGLADKVIREGDGV